MDDQQNDQTQGYKAVDDAAVALADRDYTDRELAMKKEGDDTRSVESRLAKLERDNEVTKQAVAHLRQGLGKTKVPEYEAEDGAETELPNAPKIRL